MEKYFKDLYASNHSYISKELLESIPNSVSHDINIALIMHVTKDDIRITAFSIDPEKSLGPDG